MNKSELIEEFARLMGVTARDSGVYVNVIFKSIADTLARGGRVEIRGFDLNHTAIRVRVDLFIALLGFPL